MPFGLAASPFVTALCANSPQVAGERSGYLSYRTYIWDHTDPVRCGLLAPLMAKKSCTFADYAGLLLELPLMFRYGPGSQVMPAHGYNLAHWISKADRPVTVEDIKTAMQQFFTEVRLKAYIEFRGADCPPQDMTLAIPAMWVGMMYYRPVRKRIWELCCPGSTVAHHAFWQEVAHLGLAARFECRPISGIMRELLELAQEGLKLRARQNEKGEDERIFLRPISSILEHSQTPANILLARWPTITRSNIEEFLSNIEYRDFC